MSAQHVRHARLGYAMVIVAAILFGLNGGVSRVAMGAGLEPDQFTTLRVTAAAFVFALYAACFRRSALRRPRGTALLWVIALGLFGVAMMQLAYNVAITRLPLGIALLIEYLAPVFVVLWVRFVRKEAVRPQMWAAVTLAVGGLAVVSQVWNGLEFDGLGVLMALLAAIGFAAYFLIGEHNVGIDDPLRVILWAFIVATVAMNLFQPIWETPELPSKTSLLGRLSEYSINPWIPIAMVVVLGTVVPFFLQLIALRHLTASIVVVVAMLEPVIANVLGWAWFEETLTPVQVLGAAAVIGGIVLAQTSRRIDHTIPRPE